MNISSLLDILRSQTKIVSDKNSARIHCNIISQAGHQIVPDYICITLIEIYKTTNFLNVFYYYICGISIVFPCNNVICRRT